MKWDGWLSLWDAAQETDVWVKREPRRAEYNKTKTFLFTVNA